MPTPLDFPCPTCRAGPGQKCTNYTGRGCAPHRGRGGALSFEAAARARNKAQAQARAREQAQAPLFASLDAPPAEATAQSEYARALRARARAAEGVVTPDERGVYTTSARQLLTTLKVCTLRQMAARHVPAEALGLLDQAAAGLPLDHRTGFWADVLTGKPRPIRYRVVGQRQTPHGTLNAVETDYWPAGPWQAPYTRETLAALFAWENDQPAEVSDGGLAAYLETLPLFRGA